METAQRAGGAGGGGRLRRGWGGGGTRVFRRRLSRLLPVKIVRAIYSLSVSLHSATTTTAEKGPQ